MKLLRLLLCVLVALLSCVAVSAQRVAAPVEIHSVDVILQDMSQPHQSRPHGVPLSYDWARGPRLGLGNHPGRFRALIAWGQLYEAAEGNPATNTRVQIRNLTAYRLDRDSGQWVLLQHSPIVAGFLYREDFSGGNQSRPAHLRREPSGGISVKAGGGYTFHFWSQTGRVPITPEQVGGILVTCQARLAVDNQAIADDRDRARYVMNVGGDYWLNETAEWDHFTTNADIGMGRFKYVTSAWQSFNMTTLSPAQLRRHPPPRSSGNSAQFAGRG